MEESSICPKRNNECYGEAFVLYICSITSIATAFIPNFPPYLFILCTRWLSLSFALFRPSNNIPFVNSAISRHLGLRLLMSLTNGIPQVMKICERLSLFQWKLGFVLSSINQYVRVSKWYTKCSLNTLFRAYSAF